MAKPQVADSREHALAVTRDYISQPRLSELPAANKAFSAKGRIISPFLSFPSSFSPPLCTHTAYKTVSGVNGPLVILDQVKVSDSESVYGICADVSTCTRQLTCTAMYRDLVSLCGSIPPQQFV